MALGPEGFKQYAGHFWGFLETRPYMRARAGLASTLLQLGDVDGALAHYRDMLKLNPNDNQGIRYVLAGCLLRQDNDSALKELLAAHEDGSAFWLYTRALVAFRESGDGGEASRGVGQGCLVRERARARHPGRHQACGISEDGYVTMGGPDEATYYVTECGAAWHSTPGAVAWLTKLAAALPPKRRTRATMHRSPDARARPLGPALEGLMADIDWKPLPTGLWTPPAVFAEVGNLLLEAFTDDGVPTWEISRQGNGANGTSSPRALPTPSRRPKRRRFSKGRYIRENHKGRGDSVRGSDDRCGRRRRRRNGERNVAVTKIADRSVCKLGDNQSKHSTCANRSLSASPQQKPKRQQ